MMRDGQGLHLFSQRIGKWKYTLYFNGMMYMIYRLVLLLLSLTKKFERTDVMEVVLKKLENDLV